VVPAPVATEVRKQVQQVQTVPGSGLPAVGVPLAPLPGPVETLPLPSAPEAPVSVLPAVSVPQTVSSVPAAGPLSDPPAAEQQGDGSSALLADAQHLEGPQLATSAQGGVQSAAPGRDRARGSSPNATRFALPANGASLVADLARGLAAASSRLPGSLPGSPDTSALGAGSGGGVTSLVTLLAGAVGLLYLPKARFGPPILPQGPALVSLIERPG
jgi:hypothetical protein